MVDRLSNLVAIFDSPALDFGANRAEGDDLHRATAPLHWVQSLIGGHGDVRRDTLLGVC